MRYMCLKNDECRIIKNKTLMIKEKKYVVGSHLFVMDSLLFLSIQPTYLW